MSVPDYRNADPATAYPRALQALRNPGFLKTPRYQEQQTRANRVGAHPHIIEFADRLIKRGAGLGIPLFAHCIVRTYADQASAYARGVSNDSPSDGLWPHKFGAVDIIHSTLAWVDKPPVPNGWAIIGHLGKEVAHSMDIEIVWGGDWRTKRFPDGDPAHWELANWRDIAHAGDKWWSPNGPA